MAEFIPQTRHIGTVREFDRTRGQGVIETSDGTCAVVRYATIDGHGVRTLQRGEQVTFEIEQSQRGLIAVHVRKM